LDSPEKIDRSPMLTLTGIAFSSYAVTDMARARRFYEGVLGLKPAVLNDFATGQWAEYDVGSQTLPTNREV